MTPGPNTNRPHRANHTLVTCPKHPGETRRGRPWSDHEAGRRHCGLNVHGFRGRELITRAELGPGSGTLFHLGDVSSPLSGPDCFHVCLCRAPRGLRYKTCGLMTDILTMHPAKQKQKHDIYRFTQTCSSSIILRPLCAFVIFLTCLCHFISMHHTLINPHLNICDAFEKRKER